MGYPDTDCPLVLRRCPHCYVGRWWPARSVDRRTACRSAVAEGPAAGGQVVVDAGAEVAAGRRPVAGVEHHRVLEAGEDSLLALAAVRRWTGTVEGLVDN